MSLPDSWDGIFYSKETGGDMLFDLRPEEFISTVLEQQPGEEFLIAGAISDLLWNGQNEIAKEMMARTQAVCADQPWSALPVIVLTAKQILDSGAEREAVATGVNNAVSAFFRGGISIHVMSGPRNSGARRRIPGQAHAG